jgi:hypothetical protein
VVLLRTTLTSAAIAFIDYRAAFSAALKRLALTYTVCMATLSALAMTLAVAGAAWNLGTAAVAKVVAPAMAMMATKMASMFLAMFMMFSFKWCVVCVLR